MLYSQLVVLVWAPGFCLATAAPRAVLFDIVGTVVTDHRSLQLPSPSLLGHQSLAALLEDIGPEAMRQFEMGRLDESGLANSLSLADEDVSRASAVIRQHLHNSFTFIDDHPEVRRENAFGVQTLLRELSARCPSCEVHAFSNEGVWWRIVESKLRLSSLLSWSFVSCETGLLKPSPEAYQNVLSTLGLEHEPASATLIDSSHLSCRAARALGMDAIEFTDAAALRLELISRGFSELRV